MLRNLIVAVAACLMLAGVPAVAQENDPENTLIMQLDSGTVTIRLRPDLAPNHVARAKELARAGFYDGTPFHRVIDGFMAQGGDPTGTGTGGSDLPDLKAEFTNTNFGRGVIGAARTDDPDTANSQFFICFQDCSFLNGAVHGLGRGGRRHGTGRQDQARRAGPGSRPHRIGEGRRRRELRRARVLARRAARPRSGRGKRRPPATTKERRRHGRTGPGKHAGPRDDQGQGDDRAPPRPRAQPRGADQGAGARGLLRRDAVPPRHRRLHGAGRRPDRHRDRRLGQEAQGRVQRREASPRHLLDGALAEPRFRRQPVLHLLRRLALARQAVHGLGPGGRRHGHGRQDQARRAGARTPTRSCR